MIDFRDRKELHLIDPTYIPTELDNISNPNNLHKSFMDYKKGGVNWKESVQSFEANELRNIMQLHNEIENGTYKSSEPYYFTLNERGHKRYIQSDRVRDKVVQNSLNKNVLEPRLQPLLVYDNAASQKGKGISFSRSRFENHLRNAYKEYDKDCYILLIDFSKYFDNILHGKLIEQMKPYINEAECKFLCGIIKEFEVDVSYMTDEEYDSYIDIMFNSLEYNAIDKSKLTGIKSMAKSVPIGSHTSQISGLFYPHSIDNYCKIVKGIKYYGRYMDDTYIILKTKEELKLLLSEISSICKDLGIFINYKKTRISHISSIISYLKISYFFNYKGRLIRKISKDTIHREYKRLHKYKHLIDSNRISLLEVLNNYKSWRGSYKKFDSKDDIFMLDKEFIHLFGIPYNYNE